MTARAAGCSRQVLWRAYVHPLFFASYGVSVATIGLIKAMYPGTWGLCQIASGALSDRWGRRGLIAWGMVVQALGIWLAVLVPTTASWIAAALLQGLGTAMVYPTLLAAIGDQAQPEWRASALGVYRFWRDLGYAVGALLYVPCRRNPSRGEVPEGGRSPPRVDQADAPAGGDAPQPSFWKASAARSTVPSSQ